MVSLEQLCGGGIGERRGGGIDGFVSQWYRGVSSVGGVVCHELEEYEQGYRWIVCHNVARGRMRGAQWCGCVRC